MVERVIEFSARNRFLVIIFTLVAMASKAMCPQAMNNKVLGLDWLAPTRGRLAA